jgi:Tripartite tricarboxylate transporter TctB family
MNDSTEDGARDRAPSARRNLQDAVVWVVLGGIILVASLSMDRLESQGINPYTAPGLLPGLLGVAMMCLGGLLAFRSIGEGALTRRAPVSSGVPAGGGHAQLLRVLALCLIFTVALLGHGLPFWLVGAIFVSTSILTLQQAQRQAAQAKLGLREIATAVVIGLGAGGAITLIFQTFFLVRLP